MKDFWSIARWFFLAVLGTVLLLLISKPEIPAAPVSTEAHKQLATQFEQKLEHLEQAKAAGESGSSAEFEPGEVNAGVQDMAANARQASPSEADVHIVGVNFVGDEAIGEFVVNRYGKDVYITMSGRLSAKDGYANIELTSAKIGRLSVPVSLINPRLQQRLAEPAQRERLKLPDFIADLRVENGKLIVVQK